jgi:uncharacterized RDD family membrane protein YckC
MEQSEIVEYAGFWVRVWASLVDTVVLALLLAPLGFVMFGEGEGDGWSWSSAFAGDGLMALFLNHIVQAALVLLFWYKFQATPGKMLFKLRIADATTGGRTTLKQDVIRYLGYFLSTVFMLLGFIWVAFDKRKQGWHDKLANTVVLRPRRDHMLPVRFDQPSKAPGEI